MLICRRQLLIKIPCIYRNYNSIKWLNDSDIQQLRSMALPKSRSDPVIMQLDSPNFHAIFTPELDKLASIFDRYGYEIRIAGGAVRDLLSGATPTDLDFATTATPSDMKNMFDKEEVRMINANGEKHGTVTCRINDKENFEVTTLRIDVVTDGRRAQVQFTTDWMLDAMRRDLTINSMFLDFKGRIYDYFYGYEDLKSCKVRFVGDPNTRIREDYLRILRYFRFYGKISKQSDNHEPETLDAIKDNKSGLADISGERIWSELRRILSGPFAGDILRQIIQCDLSIYIGLPSCPDLNELERVWTVGTKDMNPITLLCSVLNTQEDAVNLNTRLKLSAFERELALFVVVHRKPQLHQNPLKGFQDLVVTSKKPMETFKFVVEVLKYNGSNLLDNFEKWHVPRFPITGALLKEKGVASGKMMGLVLNKLKDHWTELHFCDDAEEILKYLPDVLESLEKKEKKTN